MFVLKRKLERAVDYAEGQEWYLKKRIRELEQSLWNEQVKNKMLCEDNKRLYQQILVLQSESGGDNDTR